MTATTPEAEFATALAKFQAVRPHIGKDSKANAGTYSYSYAALPDVLDATMPLLAEHGLSFYAAPTLREDGAFVLRYALLHVGGHQVGGDYPLPAQANPQQIGSAVTYGRRYCFTAVTGIAPDEDDDGAKASDAHTEPLPRAPRRRNATERRGAPDDPSDVVDEWTAPQTDHDWLESARHRLLSAQNVAEVEAVIADAKRKLSEKRLSAEDALVFKGETDQRLSELVPAGAA